jgi:hypothetical protein
MRHFFARGQFQRYVALPAQERRRLLQAAFVVAIARLALWMLPFRWVCAQMSLSKPASLLHGMAPAAQWAWAVRVAARRIPGATCLTQALALQWLLARAGHSARIHVGVATDGARGFEAHAWLESEGEILLGNDQPLERFVPLVALPRSAP